MDDITLAVYKQAIHIMFSRQTPIEGIRELSAIARRAIPHPIWNKLNRLRLTHDLTTLTIWVQARVSSYRQNAPILFFSLSDMGDALSLIFLKKMREPNGDNDWAAYDRDVFHLAPSKILKRMYQLGETELADGNGSYTHHDVRWIIEACYPLVYVGLTIGSIMRTLPSEALLGVDASRRIAIFFAEGDDFFFGEITRSGFRQYNVPEFVRT